MIGQANDMLFKMTYKPQIREVFLKQDFIYSFVSYRSKVAKRSQLFRKPSITEIIFTNKRNKIYLTK